MRIFSHCRAIYLSHFSKPVADRALYAAMRRAGVCSVLEIGIGSLRRTLRMLDLATTIAQEKPVRYLAIDEFEARANGADEMALKEVHRLLKPSGAQVQLIPGEPSGALTRAANSIKPVDLVVLSSMYDENSLGGGWFYLPRMLHEKSLVLVEATAAVQGSPRFRRLTSEDIGRLAGATRRRRAA